MNNHPLLSVCTLQSKQIQCTCEVRSIPATNTNRFPVVFGIKATLSALPDLLPRDPVLPDPTPGSVGAHGPRAPSSWV